MGKKSLAPFLISRLEKGTLPTLQWINRDAKLFKITWKHAAGRHWLKKDGVLLKEYAIHARKYVEGREGEKENYPKWKQLLRNVLTKSNDFEIVDLSQKHVHIYRYRGDLSEKPAPPKDKTQMCPQTPPQTPPVVVNYVAQPQIPLHPPRSILSVPIHTPMTTPPQPPVPVVPPHDVPASSMASHPDGQQTSLDTTVLTCMNDLGLGLSDDLDTIDNSQLFPPLSTNTPVASLLDLMNMDTESFEFEEQLRLINGPFMPSTVSTLLTPPSTPEQGESPSGQEESPSEYSLTYSPPDGSSEA